MRTSNESSVTRYTVAQVSLLLHWNATKDSHRRLHTLVALLLHTGLRISEALNLTSDDVDMDNLVMKVHGKGGKHRLVPISVEFRKRLWRFTKSDLPQGRYLFRTKFGTKLSKRDLLRDFKKLCSRLRITGVRCSPHTLRHSFAVNYLRAGGNLFYLSKILGHSSVKTTERYLQSLQVEDLQAVHNRFSLLARG